MKAPQIIMIVLMAINMYSDLQHHGEPREGTVNFGITVLGTCISIALLWWGGFWR